eukprot:TRINITY_DN9115_c0_g1_i1.p1 TRINITY_DN9115_c0_g1~~TRINITY_DN9115_c0_g1_i1.p1  ORF type:complete len:888 (+),score=257.33 TRINITY_DN9115_c0_g1_i1:122-2785(+)
MEKSGYLKKQGHQVKNWKTRFFVIKGDKILYYTNEQLTTLKGTIALADCYEVIDDPRRGPKNFVIRNKENRSYFIEADTEAEKNSWLSCIQKAGAAIFAKRTNSVPEENEDGSDLSQEGSGTTEDKSNVMTIYLSADCALFKWIQAEQNWETVDEFAKLVLIHHEDQSRYRIACYSNDCRYLLNSWYKSLAVSSMPKQPECAQLEVANGETTEFWGIRFCSEAHSKTFADVIQEINSNGSLSKGFVPIDLRSPENEEYDEKSKAGKNTGNSSSDFAIAPLSSLFGAKKKNALPAPVISVVQSLSQSLQQQTIELLKGFLDLEGYTTDSSHVVLDTIPIALEKSKDCIYCNTFLSGLIEKTKDMYKSPSLRAGTPNFDQNAFLAASGMAKFGVISDLNYKISEELGRIKSLAYQISVTLQYLSTCDTKESSTGQVLTQITIQSLNFLQSMDRLLSSVVTLKFIQSASFSAGEGVNQNPEPPKEEKTKPIKEKPDEGPSTSSIPSAGTLEQLITRLTPDRAPLDMTYRNTFIRTYRSFAAPWELLDALKQRYETEVDEKRSTSIQLRVAGVIKYWLETNLNDFDDHLMEVLLDFIKTMAKDGHAKTAEGLEKYLLRKQEERKQQANATVKELSVMDIPMPEFGINILDLILETKTHVLAEQLTLIDCYYYYKIEASELLNESWMKPKLKHRAPHVLGVIGRSTTLSFWVATIIQLSDNPTVRAKVMTKMIKIGKCLLKLNNFNTMFGIVAGLTMNPIFRLKNTFSRVPDKHKQAFQEIQDVMNPQSSYRNHRARVATSKRPLLPYLGILLTDLTMIEAGTRDYTADGLINFRKRESLSQAIYETTSFIDIKYQFQKVEPIYTLLRELPHLDSDDLYEFSLDREPRDPKQ